MNNDDRPPPSLHAIAQRILRFGHLVVLLSMFVALLQKVDMSDEHGPGQAIYGVVLVAANVLMLAAIAGESLYSVFSHIEDDSSVYCNGLVRCWRRWRSTVKDDAAEGFESFDEQNWGMSPMLIGNDGASIWGMCVNVLVTGWCHRQSTCCVVACRASSKCYRHPLSLPSSRTRIFI